MRIFVAPPLASGDLTVRGDEHHYLARVRRAAVGDVLELTDGEGHRALAEIVRIGDDDSTLRVGRIEAVADRPPRIRALLPLIKGDRMDTAIEKLTETGVDEIVVWPAARSVVKLDADRRASRVEHYAATAQAAARQSGRASVPTVTWAESLSAALASSPTGARLALDPSVDRTDVRALLATPSRERPTSSPPPFDPAAARAFDESAEIAVTGRYQRLELSSSAAAIAVDDTRDPEDVTSTGRFRRQSDWPLSNEKAVSWVDHVTLATGPEGGFAPAELDALAAAGFTSVGLGPRVLRAETAPSIVVALIRAYTDS